MKSTSGEGPRLLRNPETLTVTVSPGRPVVGYNGMSKSPVVSPLRRTPRGNRRGDQAGCFKCHVCYPTGMGDAFTERFPKPRSCYGCRCACRTLDHNDAPFLRVLFSSPGRAHLICRPLNVPSRDATGRHPTPSARRSASLLTETGTPITGGRSIFPIFLQPAARTGSPIVQQRASMDFPTTVGNSSGGTTSRRGTDGAVRSRDPESTAAGRVRYGLRGQWLDHQGCSPFPGTMW